VIFGLPFAPLAAVMVLALAVGVVRLMFTGTIELPIGTPAPVAANVTGGMAGSAEPGSGATTAVGTVVTDAVLVVGGWGSSCCDAANGLRATLHGATVRQFSYIGLDAKGRPVPSGPDADDLPLPVLGDRMAAQLEKLHELTGRPVDVVAESEGTLGVYAMLDRHPGLPIGSIALLSPIVEPGQFSYTRGPDGRSVSGYALDTLNRLVGGMSPYGPGGAQHLLSSVSEFGARYFDAVAGASGKSIRWFAVVPLADAVTLPVCGLPPNVVVIPAFHGGLLGDSAVLPMVSAFLAGRPAAPPGHDEGRLRVAAEVITGATAAWRMPDTRAACP
jgi:hypothetical protein